MVGAAAETPCLRQDCHGRRSPCVRRPQPHGKNCVIATARCAPGLGHNWPDLAVPGFKVYRQSALSLCKRGAHHFFIPYYKPTIIFGIAGPTILYSAGERLARKPYQSLHLAGARLGDRISRQCRYTVGKVAVRVSPTQESDITGSSLAS